MTQGSVNPTPDPNLSAPSAVVPEAAAPVAPAPPVPQPPAQPENPAPPLGVPILEMKKISKTYTDLGKNRQLKVLIDIDLTVQEGDFLAIMGKSGSGKSTLLNIIGLLDRPTSGIYEMDGKPVAHLTETQGAIYRRRHIGFIFQSFNLLQQMNMLDNVAIPLRLDGVSKEEAEARAQEVLQKVGLSDRLTHLPSELSGGQQQRVAIARAMVNRPRLLIADEPTGNLDPGDETAVMKLFLDLNTEHGKTIIMVTHNPNLGKACKRILYLEDGQVNSTDKDHILSKFSYR